MNINNIKKYHDGVAHNIDIFVCPECEQVKPQQYKKRYKGRSICIRCKNNLRAEVLRKIREADKKVFGRIL